MISGLGWRHPHYAQVLQERPELGFLQVHSENFFGAGGAALATLQAAREHYAISLHGVGLSLGSAIGLDEWHLDRLEELVQRIEPVRVSDHACFARGMAHGNAAKESGIVHAADLLPIPFTQASLDVLCSHVQQVQERLKRPLLVENLSAYLSYAQADFSETEFLNDLTQRTGCQLLLDVNNVFVNALNTQRVLQVDQAAAHSREHALRNSQSFLQELRAGSVGEMHLAGHCEMPDIVIDDHGSAVCEEVWQLYVFAAQRFPKAPALIERDTNIPALEELLAEVRHAERLAQVETAVAA
jgi:uncharacterized protein